MKQKRVGGGCGRAGTGRESGYRAGVLRYGLRHRHARDVAEEFNAPSQRPHVALAPEN